MKKKKKILILSALVLIILTAGITYSVFSSSANISIPDQNVAKFIFESKPSDNIEIVLNDLIPGTNENIDFTVVNNNEEEVSQVNIEYEITMKTYHFIPLELKLYKIIEDEEVFIYECDETYSRNEKNELICNSPVQQMEFDVSTQDNYRLKINYPKIYNDISYSELTDFINLEIKSWQKLES